MKTLFYIFSEIFTCIVCFLALLVTLFNTYLFIRRRFPVKVNCWFCNTWTKVEYDNRNSFECPTCLQYNGFTKDGGYDRTIPEHYDARLNRKASMFIQKRSPQQNSPSKRLCATCNHNQGLKVFQLANFVPLVEKNYDVEVEHFQKQLEKAYRLCKRCEELLERTLQTQNLRILGDRVRQLQKETVSLLDLSKPYNGALKTPLFIKFIRYSVLLFAGLMFVNAIASFDYTDRNLKKLLPHYLYNIARRIKFIFSSMLRSTEDFQMEMSPIINTISRQCTEFTEEIEKLSTNIWWTIREHELIKQCLETVTRQMPTIPCADNDDQQLINVPITAVSGLLLQMILCFWKRNVVITRVSQVISWLILVVLSLNLVSERYNLLQMSLKIFCPLFIIYTTATVSTSVKRTNLGQKKARKKNMRKLVKEDEIFSDLSDDETFPERQEKQLSFHSIRNAQTECDAAFKITANNIDTASSTSNKKIETDLNLGLSNLALGGSSSAFSKPLLSPPKFDSITKNPWTAGGFWSNSYTCASPEPAACNLSHSSSHSSGFGSHLNDNLNFGSLPASPRNSVCGGDDQLSVFSEPPYHSNNVQLEFAKGRNGAMTASLYSPNPAVFGSMNPFQQPVNGMLWNDRRNVVSGITYTASMVNRDWPHSTGFVGTSLFKNIGERPQTNSFRKIRD